MSVNNETNTTCSDTSTDIDEFYQTDFYSEDGDGDVSVKQTKKEREVDVDPGKHVIYRRFGESGKKRRIVVYSTSSTPGRLIRNAVNGFRYNYRVGYADEDLFYSVILASGEVGQTPAILFYDTPEQYEAHFHAKLPDEAKAIWLDKYNAARRSIEGFDRKTNTYGSQKVATSVEVR